YIVEDAPGVEDMIKLHRLKELLGNPEFVRRLSRVKFERGTSTLISSDPDLTDPATFPEAQKYDRIRIYAYAKPLPPGVTDPKTYLLGQSDVIDQQLVAPQVPAGAQQAEFFGPTLPIDADNLTLFLLRPRVTRIVHFARYLVRPIVV